MLFPRKCRLPFSPSMKSKKPNAGQHLLCFFKSYLHQHWGHQEVTLCFGYHSAIVLGDTTYTVKPHGRGLTDRDVGHCWFYRDNTIPAIKSSLLGPLSSDAYLSPTWVSYSHQEETLHMG